MEKTLKKFIKNKIKQDFLQYDFKINNFYKLLSYISLKNILMFIVNYNNKLYFIYSDGDKRKKIIFNIFKKIIILLKNKNIINKNFFIPFFVSDSYFYHDNDIPILIEAKPCNKKGILFPDITNFCFKINNNKYNYDEFINLIKKKCKLNLIKKPLLYFKGANTGADKHNIRLKLYELSKNNQNYKINIGEKFIPIYKFCKYKYLLNLPGNQPWSYRFMQILNMNSLVIDINVLQSYNNGKTFNDKWITFFSNFFIPNKHYIEINYKWIENITPDSNVIEIYRELNNIFNYYEKYNNEYNKIVEKCMKQVSYFNIYVYQYTIYKIILHFINKLYEYNDEHEINKFIEEIINLV